MKKNIQPRLMKVVEIQSNYQKHRKRLMSIQHFNTKKHQHISTLNPSSASTTFKQFKNKADLFGSKAKSNQIQHDNMILIQKIEKQYLKPNDSKRGVSSGRQTSQSRRSISSSHSARQFKTQNIRILGKIKNAKSNYSKYRTDRIHNSSIKLNQSRGELMNLLVHQLGVKPSVLFPKVSPQPKSSGRNSSVERSHPSLSPLLFLNNQAKRKSSINRSGR